MPRTRGPFQDEVRAAKHVQDMYDDLVQTIPVNPVIRWCIQIAKKREALKAAREAATDALADAENKVQKLEELIASKVPAGKSLQEATSDAQRDITKTTDTIDKLIRLRMAFQDLQPDVVATGLQVAANMSSFDLNETSANAVKTDKEHKLKELADLAEQLRRREEDFAKREEEASELDIKFDELMVVINKTSSWVNVLRDDASFTAMAKLPSPAVGDGERGYES